jgi:DNA repair exonuclease SbcCD ATPase subunit
MNKKLLTLLWAYVWWIVIATIYNKKKPSDIEKELEVAKTSWDWSFKVLLDNFIEIHENFFENIKNEVWTPKNKKYLSSKRDELYDILSDYKEDWEKLLKELEIKWKWFTSESLKKLEKIYEERVKELEKFKNHAPEKFEEFKEKLKSYFEELKKKINDIK